MSAPRQPTVAITGCGWVTPFAAGTIDEVLPRLSASRPVRTGGSFNPVPESVLGELSGLPNECVREPLVCMTTVALRHALRSAGLEPTSLSSERVGLAIGCALAGQLGMIDFAEDVREQSARFVSPIRFPQTVGNYLAGAIARGFGVRGPGTTLACGTASGLSAVIEAASWLAAGRADLVVAGGADVFIEPLAEALGGAFEPMADAACTFILERSADAVARGGSVLGEIETDATGSDASFTSTAGFRQPGAIYIEHWTGRSLAASGAAALAAAIGVHVEFPVPIVAAEGSVSVESNPKRGGDALIANAAFDPATSPRRLRIKFS